VFSKSTPKQNSTQLESEELALVAGVAAKALPISELNAENRSALCKTATMSTMQRNDILKPENSHRYLMYLVEGSVLLFSGKDEIGSLTAGSNDAMQPLFIDKEQYQSIKSPGFARIARFGREQMDILMSEQQKNAVVVVDLHLSELDNLIFEDIRKSIVAKNLVLASFSQSSTRILTAIANKAGIPELASMIHSDPALAASILRAAQRAEGGNGDMVQTVRGAISRMGVEATIQSITSQLKENTIICSNPIVEERFVKYMKRSLMASKLSQTISKDMAHLKPEEVALNSLLSDIGELAIITSANKLSDQIDDAQQLQACVENLRTLVSQWILKFWNFPESFVYSAINARDWYRNHPGEISLADIHTSALLVINGVMPESEQSSIPNANNLLLARRLQQAGVDLTSPETIMQSAKGTSGDDAEELRKAG